MPSAYTASLRLVLPVTGELDGLWGDTVNNGLTSLVDDAIAGTATVAMADANYTLTVATEMPDEARCMFITLTGALTAQRNVVCPSQSKLYFVTNNTTGGQNILFKTAAGAGVLVAPGKRAAVYCNGSNVLVADTVNDVLNQGLELDVPSAATTDIGSARTPFLRITGTTGITSFGTVYEGPRYVRFAGVLTLTHNATTLILPGGANITTGAGDSALLVPVGNPGTGWRVAAYQVAALVPGMANLASNVTGVVAQANGGTGTTDGSNLYQTGDIMFKARNSNAPGWLKLNGNSIGSAASGATARANADTEALFVHLWNEYPNAVLTIQTSAGTPTTRGASGAADFAANRRMPLFDARGDVFRGLDEGKGVDPGRVGGTEQFDAFQDHAHTVVRTSDNLALQVGGYALSAGGVGVAVLGTGSDGFQGKTVATLGGGTPRTASETRMRNLAFPAFIKL